MKKITLLSLSASMLLANVADFNFYYQDYMDFGQNKGRFTPGATDFFIKSKDGKVFTFEGIPMPDFVGPTDTNGVMTFVGGSYVFTASHTRSEKAIMLDRTYNQVAYNEIPFGQGDTSFVRYDKFITSLIMPQGVLEYNQRSQLTSEPERYTHFWRSGQGTALTRSQDWQTTELQKSGIRTGGLVYFKELSDAKFTIWELDKSGAIVPLPNITSTGDSGSPLWVWDNVDKKWLVLGADSNGIIVPGNRYKRTAYAHFRQNLLDELIQKWTNPTIKLNGNSLEWKANQIGDNTLTSNKEGQKDIVLQGGGTITLTADTDQGSGGIYFLADKTKTQTDYTITSNMGGGGYTFLERGRTTHR